MSDGELLILSLIGLIWGVADRVCAVLYRLLCGLVGNTGHII